MPSLATRERGGFSDNAGGVHFSGVSYLNHRCPESCCSSWVFKMMEFGDRKIFAVQLELDLHHSGAWLFGRFCYWINGVQVGDYDPGTSLRDVLFNLKWIDHDRGNRREKTFCDRSVEDVFSLLDNSLYGDEQIAPNGWLPEAPARFDVRPPVDVFDGWKIYLVECQEFDLMIYRKIDVEQRIQVFEIPRGMFDTVIKETYDYLERLYVSQDS